MAEEKNEITREQLLAENEKLKEMIEEFGQKIGNMSEKLRTVQQKYKMRTEPMIVKIVLADKRRGKIETLEMEGEWTALEVMSVIKDGQEIINNTMDEWIEKHKDEPEEAPEPVSNSQLKYINDLTKRSHHGDIMGEYLKEIKKAKLEDMNKNEASELIDRLKP